MKLGLRSRDDDRRVLVASTAVSTAGALLALATQAMRSAAPAGLDRFLPALIALAFLCIAWLSVPRVRGLAWFAASCAAALAALDLTIVVRTEDSVRVLPVGHAVLAGASLVAAACIAAGYAARRRRPVDPTRRGGFAASGVRVLAMVGAGASIGSAGWVFGTAAGGGLVLTPPTVPDVDALRVATRVSLSVAWIGILIGATADVGPAARRAWARHRAASSAAQPTGPLRLLSLLADELLPSRQAGRREIQEAERARIAADLHALVLPDLRRAAAGADAGQDPEALRASIRRALRDVEQLMHGRQSVVLEAFGLVAALEWLAERTEDAGPLRVELDLDGDRVADAAAVPLVIGRAAFRIALIALDNVVRHAGATSARVTVVVDADSVELTISDDGDRATDVRPRQLDGRGLADAHREAEATGGTVRVGAGGTPIVARWPLRPAA